MTAIEFANEVCAILGGIIKPRELRGIQELFEQAIEQGREEYSGLAKHLWEYYTGRKFASIEEAVNDMESRLKEHEIEEKNENG